MQIHPIPVEETRPLRHAVLRPHQDISELAAHESEDAFAVGAFDDGELVAVGFIVPEGDGWRVRGMATAPHARGRGAGAGVLQALVEHAGDERVWAYVRVPARSLYERAGFRVVGEEFELPDIGAHLLMERRE